MLSAVFVRPDGTEADQVRGSAPTIVAFVAAFDWSSVEGDGWSMPRIDIRRADDGDLLTLEHDAASDLFQCSLIMNVPKKILGVSSYLWDSNWESQAIMLDHAAAVTVTTAFCDKNIEKLRGMWDLAGAA